MNSVKRNEKNKLRIDQENNITFTYNGYLGKM